MDLSISRIKVTLPRRRSDLLSRPRLSTLIDESFEAKLILITAPAGYGKTSLLIEKAHNHELPFCWYNLDELDQELNRFVAYFVAALDQRFPGFEKTCAEAVQTAFQNNYSADSMARMLANEVYQFIREHLIFVLDNYHLVDSSQAVNTFVNRFIQDVDENFHLVVASRTTLPLLDLPLLVAHSLVSGLDFRELAFTPDEIQKLMLQNYSQVIPDAIAVELAERTEGWITGLLLSAQTMWQGMADRERVGRVSGVKLYDYLIHQILEQQPPELRDFLLRTSLFEEFNAELCQAVLGTPKDGPSWQTLIRKAIHYNLFVLPIGEEGRWLRYHHLFRDFLQHHLAQEQPEEEKRLLRSLVQVYALQKDWERAYANLQRLNDTDATAAFLENAGEPMVQANQLTRLAEWLDALPGGILGSKPTLLARRGIVAATLGETHWGLELLDKAVSYLREDSNPPRLAGTLVWRALVHHILGNYPASLADLNEVLEMAKNGDIPAKLKAEANRISGLNFRLVGDRDQAASCLKASLELFQAEGDNSSVILLLLNLGALYLDTGELKAGLECLTSVLEYHRKAKNSYALAGVLNDIGYLHYLRGEYEQAEAIFTEALQHARASSNRRVEALVLTGIGDLYIDLEVFQAAEGYYNQAGEVTQRIQDQFLLFYLAVAKTALARLEGNLNQAHRFLDTANAMAQKNPTKYTQALYLMEAGRLALTEKEPAAACCFLEEAAQLFGAINQRVEASRANFCLAAAYFETGASQETIRYLSTAYQISAGLDNPHTLVPEARRDQTMLENLVKKTPVSQETINLIQLIPKYDQTIAILRQRLRRQKSGSAYLQTAPKLHIQALGSARVTINKKTITSADWQTQKARELFFLILSSDRGWSKEAIGDMLWPDSTPAQLRLRFKNTIYRLRRVLGQETISFDGERYMFNRRLDYTFDVEIFVDCLARAEKSANSAERSLAYQEAIQIYNGAYLPEISGTWASVEREHLQQAYVEIRLKLANTNLEVGEFHSAISICNNLILEDPVLEEAHRVAMRAYAAMGNRAMIIQQYNMLKNKMLAEMGITPSSQTETLYQKLVH